VLIPGRLHMVEQLRVDVRELFARVGVRVPHDDVGLALVDVSRDDRPIGGDIRVVAGSREPKSSAPAAKPLRYPIAAPAAAPAPPPTTAPVAANPPSFRKSRRDEPACLCVSSTIWRSSLPDRVRCSRRP
jgi:hypothetical protein